LPMPPGLDYVKLPSARKVGPGEYQARTLGVEHARFRDLRAAVLRETCSAFSPQLLLVDTSPLGLMGELTEPLAGLQGDPDGREGGERAVEAWRWAAREPGVPQDLRTVVVTGPVMTEREQHRLAGFARPQTQMTSFVAGLESLIAAADVVVGRAGYNTVCEVL